MFLIASFHLIWTSHNIFSYFCGGKRVVLFRYSILRAEPEFVNVNGAQELMLRNRFRQLCNLAGRYDI